MNTWKIEKNRVTYGVIPPKKGRHKGDIWIDTNTKIHHIFTGRKYITIEKWLESLRHLKDFQLMQQGR